MKNSSETRNTGVFIFRFVVCIIAFIYISLLLIYHSLKLLKRISNKSSSSNTLPPQIHPHTKLRDSNTLNDKKNINITISPDISLNLNHDKDELESTDMTDDLTLPNYTNDSIDPDRDPEIRLSISDSNNNDNKQSNDVINTNNNNNKDNTKDTSKANNNNKSNTRYNNNKINCKKICHKLKKHTLISNKSF